MSSTRHKESRSERTKPPLKRVQFDFSEQSLEKLDEIVKQVNAATRAEVIRRALTLYTEILEAKQRGAEIHFREADGTHVKLLPLF